MESATSVLAGPRVVLRRGSAEDAAELHRIRSEPSVRAWWGTPDPQEETAAELRGEGEEQLFVIEVDGEIAGGIQYVEENEPDYRHAGIDIYLSARFQGHGLGTEAIAVLAAHLIDDRGHRRLTIDPAVDNTAAIRSYERVGFRTVGVMREYERGPDGSWRDALLMDILAPEIIRPVDYQQFVRD